MFGLLVLLGTWQLVTGGPCLADHSAEPRRTAQDLLFVGQGLMSGNYMLAAFWVTTQEVVLGFLIAVAIGVGLGILVGETIFGERAVMPYIVAIDTMPKLAFAPLFVAWIGFGIHRKLRLRPSYRSFPWSSEQPPVFTRPISNARMLFKSIGASRWQTLIKLKSRPVSRSSSQG